MHPHRSSALGYASAASALHSRVYGACSAEAAASEALRLRVGGCIRAWRDFGPHPVGVHGQKCMRMPCLRAWVAIVYQLVRSLLFGVGLPPRSPCMAIT